MKFIKYFLISTLIFIYTSCEKDEPSEPKKNKINYSLLRISRLSSCARVDLDKRILIHDNTLALFECLKWKEPLSNLYKAIKDIDPEYWNHIFRPINDHLIGVKEFRNSMISALVELDKERGLEDLLFLLKGLIEIDLNSLLNRVFNCAEDATDTECIGNNYILSKEEILNFIKNIKVQSDTLKGISVLIYDLINSLDPHLSVFVSELKKVNEDSDFIESRYKLIEEAFKNLYDGIHPINRYVLRNIFSFSNGSTEKWFINWIKKEVSEEEFIKLLKYPSVDNQNFSKEIEVIENSYIDKLSCEAYDNEGNKISILMNQYLDNLFLYTSKNEQKKFFNYLSNNISNIMIANPFCPILSNYTHTLRSGENYTIDFAKSIGTLSTFLSDKNIYNIFKFLINLTLNSNYQNKYPSFILGILSSDFIKSMEKVNKTVFIKANRLFPTIFRIMQRLRYDSYGVISGIFHRAFDENNLNNLAIISKFWMGLKESDKKILIGSLDRFFKKEDTIIPILDFSRKIIKVFSKASDKIFNDITNINNLEKTYNSLRVISEVFSSDEAIEDINKLFSKEYILPLLKLLSSSRVKEEAEDELARLDRENILREINDRPFNISSNKAYGKVAECINSMIGNNGDIYSVVLNYPIECSDISNKDFALQLFNWLNSINSDYGRFFNIDTNAKPSLLDRKGLISPSMLNSSIALLKTIDENLSDNEKGQGGLKILIDGIYEHLFTLGSKGYLKVFEDIIMGIKMLLDIEPNKNTLWRNALIFDYTKEENFKQTHKIVNYLIGFLKDYNKWYKSAQYNIDINRSLGEYDINYSCKKRLSSNIGGKVCPTKDEIKVGLNGIIRDFYTPKGNDVKTLSELFIKYLIPDKNNIRKISFKRIMKLLYDLGDDRFEINKKAFKYNNVNRVATTIERIEVAIRDINFDNNYLGAYFVNTIVTAKNYHGAVNALKSKLSRCVNILGFCGSSLNSSEKRLANNVLNAFDSFHDLNRPPFGYADIFKAFQEPFYFSSNVDSRTTSTLSLFSLSNRSQFHSINTLNKIALLGGFSNLSRYIHDRVGRTREQFNQFINSRDFNIVRKSLFKSFPVEESGDILKKLLNKLYNTRNHKNKHIVEELIDNINKLNYNQLRLLEDTIFRSLVIMGYIGNFNVGTKYGDNNIYKFFKVTERLIDMWPYLSKNLLNDLSFEKVMKPLNNIVYFIHKNISEQSTASNSNIYKLLNESFIIAEKLLITNKEGFSGIDLISKAVENDAIAMHFHRIVTNAYDYLSKLHQGEYLSKMISGLGKIVNDNRISMQALKSYLSSTSLIEHCTIRELQKDTICEDNHHYDELAKLIRYISHPSKNGKSKFSNAATVLVKNNRYNLADMLNSIFPYLKIVK